jgi:transposase
MRSYCPPNYPLPPEKLPVSKAFTDIDSQALEALIARVSEAKDNQLALSGEDCQLLLDALVTLASM